jgi:hypothetical protein
MINILQNGFESNTKGQVQYAWYKVVENGEQFYRVVALRELSVLSWNRDQEEEGLLGRQWAAVRGLHNSRVNMLYTACGIFDPWMGIVQMYGAAENGFTKEQAVGRALQQIAAVESTLRGFPQTKLILPDLDVLRWYSAFVSEGKNILALLGYPDPRTKERVSGAKNGGLPDETSNDLASEQLEIFFRGMASLGESFIYQVTSDRMDKDTLTRNLMMVNQITSDYASQQRGVKSATVSVGIPIMVNASQGISDGHSQAESQSQGETNSDSHGWGKSESNSASHSESQALSLGSAETFGESKGVSIGASHQDSQSTSSSIGHTDSWSQSQSQGISAGQTQGGSWSEGGSVAVSAGEGASQGQAASAGASQGLNAGIDVGAKVGGNLGNSQGFSASEGSNQSAGINVSQNYQQGGMSSSSMGVSQGQSQGIGGADSVSASEQQGVSDGVNVSVSKGQNHSITSSVNRTQGSADSIGKARGVSENWGEGHAVSEAVSQSQAQNAGRSLGTGLSGGIAPSISLGRSWAMEDRVATRITEDLDQLSSVMNEAISDGGFMTDVIVVTDSKAGLKAAESLLPQALHGANVARPVVTIQPESDKEQKEMILYAGTFLPHSNPTEDEGPAGDPFYGKLWTSHATALSARHLASLTCPAIIREGTLKVIERAPKELAFYPTNKGDVVMGHFISPETMDITSAPVRLDKARLMHTMFAANTGFGKSVAAMRIVREMAVKWEMRCVVLDFGLGWRQLWSDQALQNKTIIRQLHPYGSGPLRWNPLQIGRYVDPETQIRGFVDNFGSIAQLGQKQQQHRFHDAVRELYIKHGVILNENEVIKSSQWGVVSAEEAAIFAGMFSGAVKAGMSIKEINSIKVSDAQRQDIKQQISILRSKNMGLVDLYDHINEKIGQLDRKDQIGRMVLDGILQRLRSLTQGEAAKQFGKDELGNKAIPIEDLGRDTSGLTILEGGKFLGTFEKAWLLGWAGWMIYTDMVRRRELHINMGEADLVMILEEANILFTGLETGDPETNSGPSVSEQWSNMFRDSRKYGCFFMVITQSPSLIPAGIRNSCNNIVIGYLTDPKDKDVALSALARSEKGFHDEPWRRFLSSLAIGQMVARFPYSQDRASQMPFIYRPTQLLLEEPTDEQIKDKEIERGVVTL